MLEQWTGSGGPKGHSTVAGQRVVVNAGEAVVFAKVTDTWEDTVEHRAVTQVSDTFALVDGHWWWIASQKTLVDER